jgi:hypothetical protein
MREQLGHGKTPPNTKVKDRVLAPESIYLTIFIAK